MLIRAIKIDVEERTITEIRMKNNLKGIYEAVGCSLFDAVNLSHEFATDRVHSLLVDDEGAFNNDKLFSIDEKFYFGNGVIVGFNPSKGEHIDCSLSIDSIITQVNFYTAINIA